MLIGHRPIDHETIDKIDRRRSTVLPRYRERDNSAWNLSKRWREQLARQSSFVGRSTPREQDSWRNSCNWLHFGSETTKEVSSCTSNGVTVVLKILVSHLSHWIPPRTERKRVFSSAARAI